MNLSHKEVEYIINNVNDFKRYIGKDYINLFDIENNGKDYLRYKRRKKIIKILQQI